MVVKMAPGLVMAMILGTVFMIADGGIHVRTAGHDQSAGPEPTIAPAQGAAPLSEATASFAGIPDAGRDERHAGPSDTPAQLTFHPIAMVDVSMNPETGEGPAAEAAPFLLPIARRPALHTTEESGTSATRTMAGTAGGIGKHSPTIASGSALASPAADPGGPFAPPMYPDMPAKGIVLYGESERFSERQKEWDIGRSVYRFSGDRYRAGLKYDWSVDSIIGVSMDWLKGRLSSGQRHDERRDEIKGYMLNAHYHSALWDHYLVDATLSYGRVENQTEGWLHYPDRDQSMFWREDKHKSDLYGASVMIGAPLVFWDATKFLPEFGVAYTRLRGKKYTFSNGLDPDFAVPEVRATSLTVPVNLTFSTDILHSWGMIKPRLMAGVTAELDDSALAVRTLNSSAASRVDYIPNQEPMNDIMYDAGDRVVWHVGLGVDVLTVGGWELSAEYYRRYSQRYSGNSFKLELAKCF